MTSPPIPYWPYYCEENAWRLLVTTSLVGDAAEAVLIANPSGRVACWGQRAAGPPPSETPGGPGEPVLWDYHVVVAEPARALVWDPDAWIGPAAPMRAWLMTTFLAPGLVRPRYQPRFRRVPRDVWVEGLATDRSHMRRANGAWLKPPPPWDPPHGERPSNLADWLDTDHPDWIDRDALERAWGLG